MQITQKELIKIVEQASTICDRLGSNFLPNQTPNNDNIINSRITTWCQTVANGNLEQFEKRLAWDGLNLSTVRQALGFVNLADEQNLPVWAETFRAILEATTSVPLENLEKGYLSEDNRFLNFQEPLPFEELFLPFIHVARQKLVAQSGANYSLLSSESHTTLERSLLRSVVNLCSQAMGENFLVFRAYEQPSLIRQLGQLQGCHSTEQYHKFIQKMLAGELLGFFQEYAVLARLVATLIEFWVNTKSEFLQRLAADTADIQATFQDNSELGEVIAIKSGLSDLHQDGRSVIAITFTSGLKLIYKPRDCGLEEAYFQLLACLNEKGIPHPLKLLQLLNRSTYAWVEYVEHLPLSDQQAVVRYYQRAGMLLCLLYVLSGADFHQENIIASGEQPVLIDLEMLMSAIARQEESLEAKTNASYLAFEQFTHSVLSTSFLPSWEVAQDGRAYDISGLGGSGGQRTHIRKLVWQYINTDGMVLGYEDAKTVSQSNLPILNGIPLLPSDYIEELSDGFCQMYQLLITHRETLLAVNSPLIKLAHHQVRSIFRPTQVYASLLKQTLQPKFLRDGVERSIALDVLSKPLLKYENKPRGWQIIAAEQKAMEQLDIPLFTTHPYRNDLKIGSYQFIEQYFIEPSYHLVMTRLRELNENDLERQIGFIRNSLYTSIANEFERPLSFYKPKSNSDITLLSKDALEQQAISIALELQKRMVRANDDSVTWMGLDYMPQSGRLQQQPMSYDFYDGSPGVALFLSALVRVTGSEEFRDLALGALQPIHHLLQNLTSVREQAVIQKINTGGGKGLGSIIYTLVRCSQLLEEPILLKDAQQIASLITPQCIVEDRNFDIMSGSAGAILGLLTLHQAIADPTVLEQAITCGHHLLNHRTVSSGGLRTWATLNNKLLTGFSHGASGIAYALLRLYETTQNNVVLNAATEAIAYERSAFSPAAQNWLDFRSEKPEFANSWCHGASGVGLARLGGLSILDTDEIRQDIEMALQTTQKLGVQEIDHLCCGNFGRIETLLVGAQKLGRSDLSDAAHKQAAWAVCRAEINGSFQIFPNLFKGAYNPGFFQGTAGIGYELLRLAHPEKLPSVLLWQ